MFRAATAGIDTSPYVAQINGEGGEENDGADGADGADEAAAAQA